MSETGRETMSETGRETMGGTANGQEQLIIRPARLEDAPYLAALYAPYVEQTAITFEYEAPGAEEFARRMEHTMERYPYLAAELSGELAGYAYAGPFHDRPAYNWAVETSIYVKQGCSGRGIGRRLHDALEAELKARGFLNMYACIAYPEEEDEYLTRNSAQFHAHLGYRTAGEFWKCGYKFGRWYHMVWMEKWIGAHEGAPVPPAGFSRQN